MPEGEDGLTRVGSATDTRRWMQLLNSQSSVEVFTEPQIDVVVARFPHLLNLFAVKTKGDLDDALTDVTSVDWSCRNMLWQGVVAAAEKAEAPPTYLGERWPCLGYVPSLLFVLCRLKSLGLVVVVVPSRRR